MNNQSSLETNYQMKDKINQFPFRKLFAHGLEAIRKRKIEMENEFQIDNQENFDKLNKMRLSTEIKPSRELMLKAEIKGN